MTAWISQLAPGIAATLCSIAAWLNSRRRDPAEDPSAFRVGESHNGTTRSSSAMSQRLVAVTVNQQGATGGCGVHSERILFDVEVPLVTI